MRSQEQRCRSYALTMGYEPIKVFTDNGVSGALIDRPGIQTLLAFLRLQPVETVVIVDDISRIARDVMAHFQLKAAIRAAGGRVESPSFLFGESAVDELLETIMAATAQYGRKGNREQVFNRMRARLEQGYWVFPPPIGYHFEKHPLHKRILVPSPAARTILGPALEDFARGRLQTLRELGLHLQEQAFFDDVRPAPLVVLEKRMTRIMDSLALYAGQIEYKSWQIERREAQHEAILSPLGLARIEERLYNKAQPIGVVRADKEALLPLRNFLRCAGCGRPLTGSIVKGKYPRYHCYYRGCPHEKRYSYSATEKVHPAFRTFLASITPSAALVSALEVCLPQAWQDQAGERLQVTDTLQKELSAIQREIQGYMRRLGRASDAIGEEIERQVEGLKARELEVRRRIVEAQESNPNFEDAWKAVHTYFEHPLELWNTGSDKQKQALLRMIFTSPPIYSPDGGVHTTELSLPYQISYNFGHAKKDVVDLPGENLHECCLIILQWREWLHPIIEEEKKREAERKLFGVQMKLWD